MPTITQTYSFSIDEANTSKLQQLTSQLDVVAAATTYVLRRLKQLHCFHAVPVHNTCKLIYAELRQHPEFKTLSSKCVQKLPADIKSSTVATSRLKLLQTSNVTPTLTYDNQRFNLRIESSTKYRRVWLQLGSKRTGIRLPLSGLGSINRFLDPAVQRVAQARISRCLCKNRLKLRVHLTCDVAVPDLKPCMLPEHVIAIDQNFRCLVDSNGHHTSLTYHTHLKTMLRQAMKLAHGPQILRGKKQFRNKSVDFWRQLAANIADDLTTRNVTVLAIENLSKIRESSRCGTKSRSFNFRLHSGFPFRMFQTFLTLACAKRGIQLKLVNPAGTSQTCSCCTTRNKRSRVIQSRFVCVNCGRRLHADTNAAINIKARALSQLNINAEWSSPYGRLPVKRDCGSIRNIASGVKDQVGSLEDPIACNG